MSTIGILQIVMLLTGLFLVLAANMHTRRGRKMGYTGAVLAIASALLAIIETVTLS